MKKLIFSEILAVSVGLGVFFCTLYLLRGKSNIPVIFVSAGIAGGAVAWVMGASIILARFTDAHIQITVPPVLVFKVATMSLLGSGVLASVIGEAIHIVILAAIPFALLVALVVNSAYLSQAWTELKGKHSLPTRKVLLCFSSEFVAISLPIFLVAHLKII